MHLERGWLAGIVRARIQSAAPLSLCVSASQRHVAAAGIHFFLSQPGIWVLMRLSPPDRWLPKCVRALAPISIQKTSRNDTRPSKVFYCATQKSQPVTMCFLPFALLPLLCDNVLLNIFARAVNAKLFCARNRLGPMYTLRRARSQKDQI
jgi:hypothetical protein